ncbi:MAG TPA: tRNA-dihydrouridine synthase family protein, partial [bacterium]|nr:tRNA-dihydrouridine synthase family protein [bacterium]
MNFWQKIKKPILALAPMAGVTDSAFRQLCKHYGADVVYTEMVSADGLYYDSKKTLELLKFSKAEKPIVVQLFGKRPATFVKAAAICQAAGFDGLDINFGCPAKKVVAHGGGVTLMRDLNNCRQIVEAVLAGTSLPVSVKIRAGIDEVTAVDFIS